MNNSTNGSVTSVPVIRRNDIDDDCLSIENRQKDYARLMRLIKLLNKTEDLNSHIYDLVHNVVDGEFLPDTPPYDHGGIAEIMKAIFQL